ncbi:MAG: trypsin-like peptidase domain-containing protein [Verrucomicrobia bacterium]|nr:trypsin-like peptidase domain-containing protein [Verrucomicrobiota bacterium]
MSPVLLAAEAKPVVAPAEAPLVGGLKDLKRLNRDLVGMAEGCGAATVSLISRGGGGAGSGVIVSEDGLILTAAHVLAAMTDEVIVIFPDGSRKEAKPLGADFDRDAAMVQITEEGIYPHVELGESAGLQRNQWCVAMGHPGGFDPMRTPPLRLGRVLRAGEFLVTDCAVVGGDSGGPLFDARGRVVGIHSNIGASLSENRHVPVDVFSGQWESLKEGKRSGRKFAGKSAPLNPDRPVMGVQLGEPSDDGGVVVEGVMEGSPAATAGLEEDDVITAVNRKKAVSAEQLIELVGRFAPGDTVKIAYRRDGEARNAEVELKRLGDMMGEKAREGGKPKGETPRAKKAEAKPEAKDGEQRAGADPLKELLDRALQGGGQLELTPELVEQMGGVEQFTKRLQELASRMGPEELGKLMELGFSAGPDEFFASSMKALQPVVAKTAGSTVAVLIDGKPAALGTVVSKEGWVLTKDTETAKGSIAVQVGGEVLTATVLARFAERDLALLKVESDKLRPVRWAAGEKPLALGAVLTAAGVDGEPLGIGVVSVRARAMADVGFLGIQTSESEEGVLIELAVKGGPAEKAGLKKGDVIVSMDGEAAGESHEFGQKIRGRKAGEEIALQVRNGEETREVRVKLVARQNGPTSGKADRMNTMSGPLSKKQTGFPEALQHDIPLPPSFCGGPLLALNGRCVGINVSRAGRVKTLAIPAADVQALLATVDVEALAAEATAAEEAREAKDRAEIRTVIREVREKLEGLEKKLEEMEAR